MRQSRNRIRRANSRSIISLSMRNVYDNGGASMKRRSQCAKSCGETNVYNQLLSLFDSNQNARMKVSIINAKAAGVVLTHCVLSVVAEIVRREREAIASVRVLERVLCICARLLFFARAVRLE